MVHRFAFRQFDLADLHCEPQFRDVDVHGHAPDAQFADKCVGAAIAALRGIGERQDEPLVAARDRLQPQRTVGGQFQRFARQIARRIVRRRSGFDQPVAMQEIGHMRHRTVAIGCGGGRGNVAIGGKFEIQQPMRVVEGRPQNLPARQILERRADPAVDGHGGGIQRPRRAEAWQRRAIGADQEHRLDQIAARLLDRQGREVTVIK